MHDYLFPQANFKLNTRVLESLLPSVMSTPDGDFSFAFRQLLLFPRQLFLPPLS